jgi:hypothetical protein
LGYAEATGNARGISVLLPFITLPAFLIFFLFLPSGHLVFFGSPGAEIDKLAPFGTERPPGVLLPGGHLLADRTAYSHSKSLYLSGRKTEGSLKKTASEYHGAFQISVFSLNT